MDQLERRWKKSDVRCTADRSPRGADPEREPRHTRPPWPQAVQPLPSHQTVRSPLCHCTAPVLRPPSTLFISKLSAPFHPSPACTPKPACASLRQAWALWRHPSITPRLAHPSSHSRLRRSLRRQRKPQIRGIACQSGNKGSIPQDRLPTRRRRDPLRRPLFPDVGLLDEECLLSVTPAAVLLVSLATSRHQAEMPGFSPVTNLFLAKEEC